MLFVGFVLDLTSGTSGGSECPAYPAAEKKMVEDAFKSDHLLVRDAAIVQKGCRLKLALVVSDITNKRNARQLGDNFLRMAKSLGPGPNPTKRVGKGIYEYMVGVYGWPSERQIVLGVKVPEAENITW